jgi:hypothetical protein
MIHWKWTQGEPYERSRRRMKTYSSQIQEISMNQSPYDNDTTLYDNKVLDDTQLKKHANNAFNIAINHDEYTWDMLNQKQTNTEMNLQGFRQVNKREDTDKKLAERQMFANVSMNPFLINSDYVNDISVQNDFLKPQTTSILDKTFCNE